MHRLTILKPASCDLKRLPLAPLEAFVLAQLDGQLTLEEVAEIAGLELAHAEALAERLLELNAASKVEPRRAGGDASPRSDGKGAVDAKDRGAQKIDPRAETTSLRPPPSRADPRAEKMSIPPKRGTDRPSRGDARAEKASLRPASTPRGAPVDARAEKASLRPASTPRGAPVDARAERASVRPSNRTSKGSLRPDARTEKVSLRPGARAETRSSRPAIDKSKPAATAGTANGGARVERRMSRKSLRMDRVAAARPAGPARPDDDVCDIDETVFARILAFDAKLATLDHYAMLDIDRDAEKKAVKRAYFAFAATFHPDRFFGKKLGRARVPLDRVFYRLTEAHDTLANPELRAAYDARLPRSPVVKRSSGHPAPIAPRPAPRKSSRAMKAVAANVNVNVSVSAAPRKSSRAMKAVAMTSKASTTSAAPTSAARTSAALNSALNSTAPNSAAPTSAVPNSAAPKSAAPTSAAPNSGVVPTRAAGATARFAENLDARPPNTTAPNTPSKAPVAAAPQNTDIRLRRLADAAKEIGVQQRAELFLKAANDALKAEDLIGAANHFRLALQYREDPAVQNKLEEVDAMAKTLRFERNELRGRAAERDERWADAAEHLTKALAARPDAAIADRAANAMRRSGDLKGAVAMAEQAIALDGKNASYQVTLGEIHLTANRLSLASDALAAALALAPSHPRAKQLATLLSKKAT